MARTIDQIYAEMIATKESIAALDGLSSTSKVSVWRLIMYICAVGISIVENLFDLHSSQIEQRATEITCTTLQWYAAETLIYQHGDTLVFDRTTGQYYYPIENPDLLIVDLAAATDDGAGGLYVKAAKINDSSGLPEPLTNDELNGLIGYWNTKKNAGSPLTVLSDDPDLLQIEARVIYDATILNSSGELLTDTTIKPVEDAINDYLLEFGVSNFNGNFQLMKLIDAMQAAQGVFNVVISLAEGADNTETTVIDILAQQDQIYTTVAGYLIVNPSYPLDTAITYEANI